MSRNAIVKSLSLVFAGVALSACSDQPTSPAARSDAQAAPQGTLVTAQVLPEPFTARARLDPYFINQNPQLMLRSTVASDLAIQRLVTGPSIGGWHKHPGPSFAIVTQGRVKITRYSPKHGCTETVYGPNEPAGPTYYEVADEIHRADVLEPEHAVEYKVRFNTPFGAPFGEGVANPGC